MLVLAPTKPLPTAKKRRRWYCTTARRQYASSRHNQKKHPSKKKPQVQCRHKCLLKEQKAKLRKTPGSKSHGKLSAQGALPLDVAHIVNDLQKREQPDKKKKPDKNNLTKKSAALHFT